MPVEREHERFLIHHSSDDLCPHYSSDEMVRLSEVVCVHGCYDMDTIARKKVISFSEYLVRARQGQV